MPARLALCLAILQRKLPPKLKRDERAAYVSTVNDASVWASKLGDWKLALKIIEPYLGLSTEDAAFGHTAACALAKAGNTEAALEQVQRALTGKYHGAARMEHDRDLDAIRKTTAFAELFAQSRRGDGASNDVHAMNTPRFDAKGKDRKTFAPFVLENATKTKWHDVRLVFDDWAWLEKKRGVKLNGYELEALVRAALVAAKIDTSGVHFNSEGDKCVMHFATLTAAVRAARVATAKITDPRAFARTKKVARERGFDGE
jgi:hypothetical protein